MYPSNIFYDKFANFYSDYAQSKKPYLSAVDNFIKKNSGTPKTLIDVGSADGKRGKIIADALSVRDVTFVDNSDSMIILSKNITGVNVQKADISDPNFKSEKKYDLVICLWNVLGHISTIKGRENAFKNLVELLADGGVMFIDVNNRYNISNYGLLEFIKNILKDIFLPRNRVGNFNLNFFTKSGSIKTNVHIFSPFEINFLVNSAGVTILERQIVDYKTGEVKKFFWNGQLLYKLVKK